MVCRPASEFDARGIAEVLVCSYNIETVEEGEAAFRDESARGIRYLVAVEGGRVLGVVSWLPHGLPKHELGELDRIAVLPEARGQGIAARLFRCLVADADEHFHRRGHHLRKLFLMTHADNHQAQAFYRKMGLEVEAVLKDHFYKGKDEIVMSLFR